jgi:Gpi18-like mannosyltransferase
LLVLAGPYAVFFAASYSEALFLAFGVAAWLCGTKRYWLWAGIFAALASATRPNGIFLAAAIVVMYVAATLAARQRIRIRTLLATLVGFLGAAAYFGYLFAHTASLVAWSAAQAQWGRALEWPWITLYQTAGRVLYASSLDRRIQFGLDIVFAVLLVAAIAYFVRKRAWAEVTYLGLTAATMMTSYSYLSLARNTAVLFPIAIAVATTITLRRRRWIFLCWAAIGLLLLVFNTWQLASGAWAD